MIINQLGWHWKHNENFAIERPNGHFGTQIILVCTKGRLIMGETEYKVETNTLFIVQSCLPHCLYADGEEYCDDWIRFSIEQEDQNFISQLDLKFNSPICLNDDSISNLIKAAEEIFNSDAVHKKETLHFLMCAILTHISDHCSGKAKTKHNIYDEKLNELRESIYNSPSNDWNIPDISASLNVSQSHFQRLYKNRFGVSCMNDVFMSRMEYAKQLLMNTDLSANEIAEKCGYQNYEYFSRSFTKYACVSPVKYRKNNK